MEDAADDSDLDRVLMIEAAAENLSSQTPRTSH